MSRTLFILIAIPVLVHVPASRQRAKEMERTLAPAVVPSSRCPKRALALRPPAAKPATRADAAARRS